MLANEETYAALRELIHKVLHRRSESNLTDELLHQMQDYGFLVLHPNPPESTLKRHVLIVHDPRNFIHLTAAKLRIEIDGNHDEDIEDDDDDEPSWRIEHPPSCGNGCSQCGHRECEISYEIDNGGIDAFTDGLPTEPGRYYIEQWFEEYHSYDGPTEYDGGIAVLGKVDEIDAQEQAEQQVKEWVDNDSPATPTGEH